MMTPVKIMRLIFFIVIFCNSYFDSGSRESEIREISQFIKENQLALIFTPNMTQFNN